MGCLGLYVAAGFGVRGNDVVSSFAAGKARKAAPGIKHTATTAMPGLRMEGPRQEGFLRREVTSVGAGKVAG